MLPGSEVLLLYGKAAIGVMVKHAYTNWAWAEDVYE